MAVYGQAQVQGTSSAVLACFSYIVGLIASASLPNPNACVPACTGPPPEHMPAQAAASVPARGLIKVGAEVELAPGWEGTEYSGHAEGPLQPGVRGVVVKDDLRVVTPWVVKVGLHLPPDDVSLIGRT